MLRALAGLPKGLCPSGLPALAGSRGRWERHPAALAYRIGGAQHQGFASPSSSPGPVSRAAASGDALDPA